MVTMRPWLSLSLLFALGCGPKAIDLDEAPDTVASLMCDLRRSCDCFDESACETKIAEDVEAYTATGENIGLTYDGQCMGDLLAKVEGQGCEWAIEGGGADSCTCKPFYGDRSEGQSCDEVSTNGVPGLDLRLDTCDAKTVCRSAICVPRCWPHIGKPQGEACDEAPWIQCADGLACTDQGVCWPAPEVGEPCEDRECEKGAFCDDDFVCAELLAQDEGCDDFRQCASDYCPNGTCQPKPGLGGECFGRCEQGLACVSQTCVAQVCL